ncbi:MAG: histidine phosphatase family protein [Acidobacteria bacterium]|nr:histidine phosphatase family protein [Acidobacteriota bacterium]
MEKFVVLLRHGIAHPPDTEPDETRELTDEGHRRMKQIARGLRRILPHVNAIISSPLTRALQTATWVGKSLDLGVTTDDALRPSADTRAIRTLLTSTSAETVILVGHEPTLTAAMLDLTRMDAESSLELKKGGCYAVRFTGGEVGQLEWMLAPRVLRRLD